MQSRIAGGGAIGWDTSPSDYHNESNTRDTPYNMCRNCHYMYEEAMPNGAFDQ